MTQFDPLYYWPVLKWDFWVGLVALLGVTAFTIVNAQKVMVTPAAHMEKVGYANAPKDSAWAALVMVMRLVVGLSLAINAYALYLWYTVSMATAIWTFWLLDLPVLINYIYRAYWEDEKNGLCSKISKEAASKNVKIYGAKSAALFVAGAIFWFEFYNGTNYVNDAKHGLPEDLTMMLGVVKNKFLKGGH